MPNLTFRGFKIRFFDVRRNEAGLFTRIHGTSDPSDVIDQRMGWEHIPDSVESCKLTGKLAGESLILTPTDKSLAMYEVQLPCGDVDDFSIHRIQSKDGESSITELRFVIRTLSANASATLAEYWSKVGEAPCGLKLRYSEQSEIEDAPEGAEPVEESQQKLSIVDGMSLANGDRKKKGRTRRDMAAAIEPTVEVDPLERERLEEIISESLQ